MSRIVGVIESAIVYECQACAAALVAHSQEVDTLQAFCGLGGITTGSGSEFGKALSSRRKMVQEHQPMPCDSARFQVQHADSGAGGRDVAGFHHEEIGAAVYRHVRSIAR